MKFLLVTLCAGLLFACKKGSGGFNDTTSFTANVRAQTDDQVRISNTIDAVFNDVDSVLDNPAISLCAGGVGIDTTVDPRIIQIAYGGSSCGFTKYLKGVITISYVPGTNWNDPLDTVAVSFYNVAINTPPDTNTILFNGKCSYTNVTGGSLSGLGAGGPSPVIHTITGFNLNLAYNSYWPSTWQIARRRTYTNNGGLTISTAGMDSVGGFAAISEWGGNRFGNSMIVGVDSPLVIDQGCGWQLTRGQIRLYNPAGVTSMIYGLDSTGAASGCPPAGVPYHYKMAWSGTDQNPYTAILPYP